LAVQSELPAKIPALAVIALSALRVLFWGEWLAS
jgi:hypothetical protein